MPLPLAALLPLVASLAPGLIKHLAGDRAGAVASEVASAIGAVVGSQDPADVELALADPGRAADLRLELARIEAEHERAMLAATLADVAGARGQTVELARQGSPIAWGAPVVSAIVLLAFAAALYAVVAQEIPEGSRELALLLLGGLLGMAQAVVAYWVGSSAGSARKDEALRGIAAGPFGQAVRR
ncbi:hypothetical protein [Synechococcus phage MinM1]|nr:hypothetical protein [Synechococcus phage MinM1]